MFEAILPAEIKRELSRVINPVNEADKLEAITKAHSNIQEYDYRINELYYLVKDIKRGFKQGARYRNTSWFYRQTLSIGSFWMRYLEEGYNPTFENSIPKNRPAVFTYATYYLAVPNHNAYIAKNLPKNAKLVKSQMARGDYNNHWIKADEIIDSLPEKDSV